MDAASDLRLSEIFIQVLESAPAERAERLAELCRGDAQLARTIAELVAASERAASTAGLRRQVLEPLEETLAPGSRIGAYTIERRIASGGMGVVYLARDTALDMPVAIKALRPDFARDERQRQRLLGEARLVARLSPHPNIATIHALLQEGDNLYIVEEYLRGPTLRMRLAQGPLPIADAIRAGLAMAHALEAAHAAGIVHRDLKPENVMATESGTYKVLDFGIAKREAPAPETTLHPALTSEEERIGTVGYMSPEQLRGLPIDRRSDVFSFGVVMYELLTGRHPFGRGGALSTWSAMLFEEPEPFSSSELAKLPEGLRTLVERCLAKHPDERPQTAGDLAAALEAAATGSRVPAVERTATSPAATADDPESGGDQAVRWWQFHEGTAAVVYWLLLIPVWHVKAWIDAMDWRFIFFTLLAALAVVPSLRLSLAFVSHFQPRLLKEQYGRCWWWIRIGDLVYAAALVAAGLAISDGHAGWATLLVAFGIGSLVVAVFVEPLTAAGALEAVERGRAGRRT